MDANGKPRMSRDMMGRIMHSQPAQSENAYGVAPSSGAGQTQRQLYSSGNRIGGYGTSRLGMRSSVLQFGTEISAPSRRKRPDFQKNQNLGENHINTQQNRPSAGFKEPPGRNYNPYG